MLAGKGCREWMLGQRKLEEGRVKAGENRDLRMLF
jgi:hypothetical protein